MKTRTTGPHVRSTYLRFVGAKPKIPQAKKEEMWNESEEKQAVLAQIPEAEAKRRKYM